MDGVVEVAMGLERGKLKRKSSKMVGSGSPKSQVNDKTIVIRLLSATIDNSRRHSRPSDRGHGHKIRSEYLHSCSLPGIRADISRRCASVLLFFNPLSPTLASLQYLQRLSL